MVSELTIRLYYLIKSGIIKSNSHFWKSFFDEKIINSFSCDIQKIQKEIEEKEIDIISVFDDDFPRISIKLKDSEKPFFFAYRGDISLLNDEEKNVAVIGHLTPTNEIVKREREIIKNLLKKDYNIVSGLANGCDTVAHNECVEKEKRTIAFLPSTIENIYPKENRHLAKKIIDTGGLIVSEYVKASKNKYENIKRFIERDRLQSLFAKAVILIASFRKGEGDSGSRHAFEKAKEYGKKRFVMFREADANDLQFGLNNDYVGLGEKVVSPKEIEEM